MTPLMVFLAIVVLALLVAVGVMAHRLSAVHARYAAIENVDVAVAARLRDAEAAQETLSRKAREELQRADAEAAAIRREAEAAQEALSRKAKDELYRATTDAAALRSESADLAAELSRRRAEVELELGGAKAARDRLYLEVSGLEENLEDISFGVYKPHFTYETPEDYKRQLESIWEQQKKMIKEGEAATCAVKWTVGDSRKDGERMQKQYTKLLLRAFNGECDAAIAKVTWNNVSKMEERIKKSFEAVNELGGVMSMSISRLYADLRLKELQLEYELEERKRKIAEEQRLIREQMREEQRAQKELERAEQDAKDEEARYVKLLDKARVEAAKARGEEHARLNARLVELEQKLSEASQRTLKVKAMAELTRAGYVYIISNIGSFGDSVFKIGLTRREEPTDRVKELGDASVPFPFDVHAMIYSEDAPALECDIHNRFASRAVNLVNDKKEFFNVSIDEIDAYMKEKNLSIYFTRLAEAREYRETRAMRTAGVVPQLACDVSTAQVAAN